MEVYLGHQLIAYTSIPFSQEEAINSLSYSSHLCNMTTDSFITQAIINITKLTCTHDYILPSRIRSSLSLLCHPQFLPDRDNEIINYFMAKNDEMIYTQAQRLARLIDRIVFCSLECNGKSLISGKLLE